MRITIEREFGSLIGEVEEAQVGLLQEISEFSKVYFGEDSRNVQETYLSWLCLSNPNGAAKCTLIRTDEGQLIAQALLIPVLLAWQGKTVRSYFVVNVLTHPLHRRKRLFSEIIELAKKFCIETKAWLVGHPNKAALKGWRRNGMTFREPWRPHFVLPSVRSLVRSSRCRSFDDLSEALKGLYDSQIEVHDSAPVLVRSMDFLKWRFFDRPDINYDIRTVKNKARNTIGYIVLAEWKYGVRLVVDYDVADNQANRLRPHLPAIAMIPNTSTNRDNSVVSGIPFMADRSMPFFLSTFDDSEIDTSYLTLAISDF